MPTANNSTNQTHSHQNRSIDKQKSYLWQSFRLLPLFLLNNFVDVHYALAFVRLRWFTIANSSCKLMNPLLINASATNNIVLEAENANSRGNSQFYFMTVSQFQIQQPSLGFSSRFVPDSDYL